MRTRDNNWLDPKAGVLWYGIDVYMDGKWQWMRRGYGFDWEPEWKRLPVLLYRDEQQRALARKQLRKVRVPS